MLSAERLIGRTHPSTFVNFIEHSTQPAVSLESLYLFGSALDSTFDRRGEFTSDIDLLAIVKNRFQNLRVPGWSVIAVSPEMAQVKGKLDNRDHHVFILSQIRLFEILDRFVNAAQKDDPQNPENYEQIILDVAERVAHGTLIAGSPIRHPFSIFLRKYQLRLLCVY